MLIVILVGLVLFKAEHADVICKFAGSAQIVTRDQMKVDTSLLRLFDDLFDALPDGVAQNNHCQESLVIFEHSDFLIAVNLTLNIHHQGFELL